MSIKNKILNKINSMKDFLNNKKNNFININKHPLFIISSNRSGASLLASLLRQHPQILSLNEEKILNNMKIKDGHVAGFSEDFIWNGLDDKDSDHNNLRNNGYIWGHPLYLSNYYKEDYKYSNALINEIFKYKTEKLILIKHPFFSLRLKLIKKIFPKAKIILNIRSYKDFIISNEHKLSNSIYKKNFNLKSSDLGLHWLLINSISIYQLEKYFANNYIIFNHEKLYDDKFDNQNLMNSITNFANLENFNFSFENINIKNKFSSKIHYDYEKIPKIAEEIAKFESEIKNDSKI